MSALIPMMKLPDNCAIGGRNGLGCPCFCHYNEECQLLGETIHTAYFSDEKRPERCPLQFVPPHGRLIDADARVDVQMYNDEFEDYQTVNMSIDDLLDSSWIELEDDPTVIPAEEVET